MHSLQKFAGFSALFVVLASIAYIWFMRRRLPDAIEAPQSGHASQDTTLPIDFHEWVYIEYSVDLQVSPLDREVVESFPNIYVAPIKYADYLRSSVFPEGTIAFRRLELSSLPNASTIAGRECRICFSPDRAQTADVRIKDSARFQDSSGWGYFQFDLTRASDPI
jgi:hypothetical protein